MTSIIIKYSYSIFEYTPVFNAQYSELIFTYIMYSYCTGILYSIYTVCILTVCTDVYLIVE